jgi:hypothetical protein
VVMLEDRVVRVAGDSCQVIVAMFELCTTTRFSSAYTFLESFKLHSPSRLRGRTHVYIHGIPTCFLRMLSNFRCCTMLPIVAFFIWYKLSLFLSVSAPAFRFSLAMILVLEVLQVSRKIVQE